MIDKNAEKHLEEAVEAETKAAVGNHEHFHSHHEAWAVLKEEIEEVELEAKTFKAYAENDMIALWEIVKNDNVSKETVTEILGEIRRDVMEVTKECIQVAAVCDKWIQTFEQRKNKKSPDKTTQLEQYFMPQFTEIDTEIK